LRHQSIQVARGASYALQGMLVTGGLPVTDWERLLPQVEEAWHDDGVDATRRAMLTDLCAALPPAMQERIRRTCPVEPPAAPGPQAWSRSRSNAHYAFARSIASAACARLRHHEEPLLERLLFEAMFDPRGLRRSNAPLWLASSPFARVLTPLLVERRGDGPDGASRPAALRTAVWCHGGEEVPDLDALLDSRDADGFEAAAAMSGRSGRRLPQDALEWGLAGSESTVRRTLQALAMAEDPRLAGLATDPRLAESTRDAARWWAGLGGPIRR
jgi:hypothetical protein